MTDISAIITGHREGLLASPAVASLDDAVARARRAGLEVETLLVLDRPDQLTRSVFEHVAHAGHRLVFGDGGDPALTRNLGVAEARGTCISFLDADDLWSFNWLTASWDFYKSRAEPAILHSEMNVIFGSEKQMWFHPDSMAADFDFNYLRTGNLWDAMSFGPRLLYLKHPFLKNALQDGYGHEDWHWNNMTIEAGIHHRPVPGTVHFKRRRAGSQMAKCSEHDVMVRPSELSRYAWDPSGPGQRTSEDASPSPDTAPATIDHSRRRTWLASRRAR